MNTEDSPEFEGMLHAAHSGEGWGFTFLYKSLDEQVAGFVRARGVQDVNDVVNDVFLAAFSGLDSFEGDEAGFRAWVFRIARNKVADWYRYKARERELLEAAGSKLVDGPVHESDQVVGDHFVAELLDSLTPDQREVVLLRIVADMTAQQTSEVLGKPLSAVKALQRRGVRKLRRKISAMEVSI